MKISKPKSNFNALNFNYPSNFIIVFKDEKNKLMIDTLAKHCNINPKNIQVNKISIINLQPKEKFICVIIVHVAYFYKIKKNEFCLYYFIDFKNKDILEKEVKEKIFSIGLLPYINLMILKDNAPYKLYDFDFKEIGTFINEKNKRISSEIIDYFNIKLENNKEYIKIHSLLICLLNIEEIRDFSPIRNNLDNTFLFSFCKILRIIRKQNIDFYSKISFKGIKDKFYKEYEDVLYNFIIQMRKLSNSENENILDDLNILIKLLILQIQKDLYKSDLNNEFIYDDISFPSEEIISKKTFIENLFFFKIELSKNCECSKTYEYKYFLQFDLNENDKDSIDILSLFKKLNDSTNCVCQKQIK